MPDLFGVTVDPLTFDEAVDRIYQWLGSAGQGCRIVFTPNVNHVVRYQSDESFRASYAEASLVLADGRYLVLASRLLGTPLPESINGSDLVPALLAQGERVGGLRIFLLGALPGVAEKAASAIEARWPWIEVVGVRSPSFGFEDRETEKLEMLEEVNIASPDLLILGISPPKQERLATEFASHVRAKVAICAGATIDFLAGEKRRAPAWMRRAGLEWAYRIRTEPRRLLGRYLRDGLAFSRLLIVALLTARRRRI